MQILYDIIIKTLEQYRRANIADANTREKIAETITGVYCSCMPERKGLAEIIREKKNVKSRMAGQA